MVLAMVLAMLETSAPAPAEAFCRMTTSRRAPSVTEPCILPDPAADPPELFLAWERPCTTIALSTAASNDLSSEQLLGVLQRSLGAWEAVSCDGSPLGIDIQIRSDTSTCQAPLYRDGGGNANTLIFQDAWPPMNDSAAFALTTVWHRRSTGEILDVDIEVNEERGPFGVCPAAGCTDSRTVDLENVLTHELGHYLGLAHSTETEATMFVSAVAGEVLKRDLHPDDIDGICTVYPPGRPSAECNYEPRGGLDLDCEEDGCSVTRVGASRDRGAPLALLVLAWIGLRARRRFV